MKFDLTKPTDLRQFKARAEYLEEKGLKVELKEIRNKRSLSQNAYLHVVITLFAMEYGLRLNEAKTDLKRECDFMTYENNGKKYLRETSQMDTKELTEFIEWIRNYASQQGLYIPTADEYLQERFYIDKQIDQHKKYL